MLAVKSRTVHGMAVHGPCPSSDILLSDAATIGGMDTSLPWQRQHGALLSGDRQSPRSQLHAAARSKHALHCVAIASPVETQLQLLCSAGPQH